MNLTATECDLVRSVVRQQSGIVLEEGKGYLIESRLAALARKEGLENPQELLAQMRVRPMQFQAKVVEALTTNETSFFRDIMPFEALKKVVLPALIQKRSSERKLTIWCAAASTGQEPYTIAMIIKEMPELANWTFQFIATDLSTQVLDQAKRGCYSQIEVNRGLPAQLLVKYFTRVGTEWQISNDLRKMVDYRPLNLLEAWNFIPVSDIVFMRNVLIYFDVDTKKSILGKVRKVIKPDGYFFLGGAETTMNLDENFIRETVGPSVTYRIRQA